MSFLTDLYLSGTTFFTLGLGDVTPLSEAVCKGLRSWFAPIVAA